MGERYWKPGSLISDFYLEHKENMYNLIRKAANYLHRIILDGTHVSQYRLISDPYVCPIICVLVKLYYK